MQLPVIGMISHRSARILQRTAVALAALALTLLAGRVEAAAPAASVPVQSGLLRSHKQDFQANRHALGVTAGLPGSFGLAYRHYFSNSALQLNLLPIYWDRGDYLAVHVGAQYIHYMLVWARGRTPTFTPASTSLRLVAGTHFSISRDNGEAPGCTVGGVCQTFKAPAETYASVAAGFGLEFGAVTRQGFSASIDLLMTVIWDREGFFAASPLPYGALMYSW